MDELSDTQIEEMRLALIALRDELATLLKERAEDTKAVAPDDAIGRLTRMDAMQQQKMAIEARRRRQIRYQQVKTALAAVKTDDYGYCRRCEEPIGYARLKARPESPFCVPCMGSVERR